MSDLDIELSNTLHGDYLGSFQCCLCGASADGGLPCTEPWAHDVQEHIQHDALPHALTSTHPGIDHRMWLLFDGVALVAVGAHERRTDVSPTSRYLPFIAVRVDKRGVVAGDAGRYADLMLGHLLADARLRAPAPTDMQAKIDPRNEPSIRFFQRHRFRVGATALSGYLPAALPLGPQSAQSEPEVT